MKLWENRLFLKEAVAKSWLFKTAYRKMLNYVRDNKRMNYEAELVSKSDEGFSKKIEAQNLLDQVFESLSPEQKTIILLRDNEGYAYQEIAKIIETSESNVKNRLFKARQKFKQTVESLEQQEKVTRYE